MIAKCLILLILIVGTILIVPSMGIMVQKVPSEMFENTDLIVTGTVVQVNSTWSQGQQNIETHAIVEIDDILKGNPFGDQILVNVRGGTVEGITQRIEDTPQLVNGTYAGFFLTARTDSSYSILENGYYPLVPRAQVHDEKSAAGRLTREEFLNLVDADFRKNQDPHDVGNQSYYTSDNSTKEELLQSVRREEREKSFSLLNQIQHFFQSLFKIH